MKLTRDRDCKHPGDFDSELSVESEVIELHRHVAPTMLLKVGCQENRTTDEHPFYARGCGWIPAGMLEAGEWLPKGDGGWVAIESVGYNGEVVSVFNFEVAEHHTYFVGKENWGFDLWTHNQAEESAGGAEHTSRKRPSTKGKREKGQACKKQDRGGEKGDDIRKERGEEKKDIKENGHLKKITYKSQELL